MNEDINEKLDEIYKKINNLQSESTHIILMIYLIIGILFGIIIA